MKNGNKTIREDIYNFESLIRKLISRIKEEISAENADLIIKYDAEMVKQGIAKATRSKNLRSLLTVSKMLAKGWSQVTKGDIDELVYKIMSKFSDGSGKETNYTYDLKKVVKLFFRWYKLGSREFKEVGDPQETAGVRMRRVKDSISREDLLTEADLTRLLYACGQSARDRALIHCQYDGGTRPGEILNLRIKDVKFDDYGAILHVDGKTGPRTVRLIQSAPSLYRWLMHHPFKDNPDAPLWVMLGKGTFGQPISYVAAKRILQRRCNIAGLEKRVYLNLFRHSEATRSAQFLTEAQMKNRHGWSADSKMPGRYVHINNADVDNAMLHRYGVKKEEVSYEEKMPKKCKICGSFSSPDEKICESCLKPLDLQTAIEIDAKMQEKNESLEKRFEEFKESMQKQMDEAKYGPFARGSRLARILMSLGNTPEAQAAAKIVAVMLEVAYSEEKKRALMREFERAEKENDKPNVLEALEVDTNKIAEYHYRLLEQLASSKPQKRKSGIKPPKLDLARIVNYAV